MRSTLTVVGTVLAMLGLAPPAGAQNLVSNGGFENGASGWQGGSVVSEQPHGGSACLLVEDADPQASVSAQTAELLPLAAGQAYRFGAWVRTPAAGQQVLISLNQYDAAGNWLPGRNMDFAVTTGTGWTEFSQVIRNFAPGAANVRIFLRPVLWSEAGELTGRAWFDDVVFEPTTVTDVVRGRWLDTTGPISLWQAPVEYKVRRDQALPADAPAATAVELMAAGGEYEPFQLVLAPQQDDALTGASVSDLAGPHGARLPAAAFTIREVAYLEVTDPTDWASFSGWLPDPLPLLAPPLPLTAGRQQPLWITVQVPAGTPPGEYSGTVQLEFQSAPALMVPLRLRVWAFALPREHHLRTAYGLDLNMINRYHNLGGSPDKLREVFRLYLQDFAAHRISPYDPFGRDGYDYALTNFNWEQARVVDDPAAPGSGNRVLEVDDQRDDANIVTFTGLPIAHQAGNAYRLSWRAHTDGAHDYLVAVNQYDGNGDWLAGYNIDLQRSGDGSWQTESATLSADQFSPQAAFLRLFLYARPWTSTGELLGRTWFDDLELVPATGGDNLIVNGAVDVPPDQITVEFDWSRFDPAASWALDTLGFDSFRLPLPAFAWGDILGPGELPTLGGWPWGSPEYEQVFTKLLRAIGDHLAERGWLNKAYAYWYDEPEPDDYDFVAQGMDLLQRAEPRLARLLTEQFEPELEGKVDIWAPLLDRWQADWAAARQQAGEQVWWYVCTGPRPPYPNNFIDHPGIEQRIRFWMAWQYGVEGSLYWSTNYWTEDNVFVPPDYQDPWQDPQSYNFYGGLVGVWGNGDGRLLYPPRDWQDGQERISGPVPSLRWELLREGIEDYELFWLLADATGRLEARSGSSELTMRARGLLDLPAELFTSTTSYTLDPGLLEAHRRAVAETLEEVLAALQATEPDGGADAGDGGTGDAGVDAADGSADESQPDADGDLPDADTRDGGDGAPGDTADADNSGKIDGCGCGSGAGTGGNFLGLSGLGLLWFALRRRRPA